MLSVLMRQLKTVKLICAVMPRSLSVPSTWRRSLFRVMYLFFKYVICMSLCISSLLKALNCGQNSYFYSAPFSKSSVNDDNNNNNNNNNKKKKKKKKNDDKSQFKTKLHCT